MEVDGQRRGQAVAKGPHSFCLVSDSCQEPPGPPRTRLPKFILICSAVTLLTVSLLPLSLWKLQRYGHPRPHHPTRGVPGQLFPAVPKVPDERLSGEGDWPGLVVRAWLTPLQKQDGGRAWWREASQRLASGKERDRERGKGLAPPAMYKHAPWAVPSCHSDGGSCCLPGLGLQSVAPALIPSTTIRGGKCLLVLATLWSRAAPPDVPEELSVHTSESSWHLANRPWACVGDAGTFPKMSRSAHGPRLCHQVLCLIAE